MIQREDATLVSWAHDLRTALFSLRHVYIDLLARIAQCETVYPVDPSLLTEDAPDGMALFEQFIQDYESSGPDVDKFQGISTLVSASLNVVPPLGSPDSVNSVDEILCPSHRVQKLDACSITSSQSPMWGDSVWIFWPVWGHDR